MGLAVWLFATGCTTVPVTGRHQFNLLSSQQEMELGLSSFQQMKQEVPISKDPQANALVERVGKRIAEVAKGDLPNAQWEFVVFDSKEANAFCLPGGKVGVYTGLLPVCQGDGGLAAVVGHEVAHAVARHGAERMSEGLLVEMGGQLLGEAMKTRPEMTQKIVMQSYGMGSQVGVQLPHSRKQELEADHLGLLYMARAGYNPQEAVEFWKRFSGSHTQQTGLTGTINAYLSTHPVDADRIAQLEQFMPKAQEEYRKAGGR